MVKSSDQRENLQTERQWVFSSYLIISIAPFFSHDVIWSKRSIKACIKNKIALNVLPSRAVRSIASQGTEKNLTWSRKNSGNLWDLGSRNSDFESQIVDFVGFELCKGKFLIPTHYSTTFIDKGRVMKSTYKFVWQKKHYSKITEPTQQN